METTLHPSANTAVADKAAAVLWNPTAAVLWSLLFSPALGAWLIMRNWDRLGEPGKAGQARHWFVCMLAIHVANAIAATAGVLLERDIGMPWWTGMMLWGIWVVLSGYPQIAHVEDSHGEDYPRGSWAGPLIIAVAAHVALPFLAGLVAGVRAALPA